MKKIYKLAIVLIVLSLGVLFVVYNSKKDNDEYSFYYIDFVEGKDRVVKYSNYKDEVEPIFVYEKGINDIYDIYSDEQMLIDGNFGDFFDIEYDNGDIINLKDIFDISELEPNIKYIENNSDIAYKKDNTILVYHKDTKEVEKVYELDTGEMGNFDFSYDGKILYYSCNKVIYAYDIETETIKEIASGMGMIDISKDGNLILHRVDNKSIYIYNIETGEDKEIDKDRWWGKLRSPIFNEDGTNVLYARYAIQPTRVKFYIYNVETGKTKMVHKVEKALPYYGW